jgi:ubiquinone/menaquinone biosynthesis C-methylase UbiE
LNDSADRDVAGRQTATTDHFQRDAPFWQEVYAQNDVFAVIHRERARRAAEEIARLGLESGSHVLEIGCGAGLLAVHLALRGLVVDATDPTPAMLELTRENAARAGVGANLRTDLADAHALAYASSTFDVVLAMGVLPWLHDPQVALGEMARVLRRGGFLVANIDNRARLSHLVDPLFNPLLQPLRRALGHGRRERAAATATWPRHFERDLARAGLERVRRFSFGFGPFTLLGRPVVSGEAAVAVHRGLQRLSDARIPVLRWTGAQYMVVARKR